MADPWDVPRTEEGRDHLIALLEEYRDAGKEREAGIYAAMLAHHVKHVGAPGDGHAFDEAADMASKLWHCLE